MTIWRKVLGKKLTFINFQLYLTIYPLQFQRKEAPFFNKVHFLLMEKGDKVAQMVTKIKMPDFFDKDNINKDQVSHADTKDYHTLPV